MVNVKELESKIQDLDGKLSAKAKDAKGPAVVGQDRNTMKQDRAGAILAWEQATGQKWK